MATPSLRAELTARGYQLSSSAMPGGSYKNYSDSISMSAPGTYFIHVYGNSKQNLVAHTTAYVI